MILENRRREMAINIVKNILATIFVLSIVALAIFFVQGWTITSSGEPQKTGLVQFITNPNGATIKIDGKEISEKSNTKKQLQAGPYDFEFSREGYHNWTRSARVNSGEILWLNYAKLIPLEIKTESFFSFKEVKQIEFSGDKKRAIIIAKDTNDIWHLYSTDTTEEELKLKEIELSKAFFEIEETTPADIFEVQKQEILAGAKIQDVSHRGDKILLSWGGEKEIGVVDTTNSKNSQNLTKLSPNATPANGDLTKFYSLATNGNLSEVTPSSKTSKLIATDVEHFRTYSDSIVLVSQKNSASSSDVAIIEGTTKKITVAQNLKNPVLAISRYYNENYVYIAQGQTVEIFKGSSWFGDNYPQSFKTIELDFTPDKITPNNEGRILIFSNQAGKNASYDAETGELFELGDGKKKWLNNFILTSNNGTQAVVEDFDGSNHRQITEAEKTHQAMFSDNEKSIFSIGKNSKGEFVLQRSKLTID